jgi:hypothetical protein
VHLERSLVYDGPWLQLEGDTPEEWEILEQLTARGHPYERAGRPGGATTA